MAGEITQEAIALALGSAGLAAAGAVGAQIVAAVFTSKREAKKATADEERRHLENEAERRDRNLDHKTDLFVRFLAVAESVYQDMAWEGKSISDDDFHAYQPRMQELREKVEEIGLIAPEVLRHVQVTLRTVGKMLEMKTPFLAKPVHGSRRDAITMAEERVSTWIAHSRDAMTAYINHETIVFPIKEFRAIEPEIYP